ncbi:hypothetical protein AN652_06945 [Xanthomonas arboricola pv. pruni]|nr:hypothetical protein DK27_02335 [Xanthomonas arboricola pv. pruni]KPN11241.1 hypothetical protein AN652_06945 [Xanthomonas arboricola pv. pruni]
MKRRWLGMLVVSVMVNAVASNIIANAFICLLLQWMERRERLGARTSFYDLWSWQRSSGRSAG